MFYPIENVRKRTPLVHNITNYVTVNDCANILLACGASPIMADDIKEVEEITSICNALVINIGTLNERTIESMILAGKRANKLNHPVILDPVGAGASALRTNTAIRLLEEINFCVIRGNISEIKTISQGRGNTRGVDAEVTDSVTEENLTETIQFAKQLASSLHSIIVITGVIDIVAEEAAAYIIRNGHPLMSKITGTGCMLTSIVGAFAAANPENILSAVAAAVSLMGLCGELAYEKMLRDQGGTASLRMHLIDAMSTMEEGTFLLKSRIEQR